MATFRFPPPAEGQLTETVRTLVESRVDISEIKRRAAEAGWTVQGVNKALRSLGIRQRGERDDVGAVRKELSAAEEADRIIRYHYHDPDRALAFVEMLRRHIVAFQNSQRPRHK